MAKCMMHPDRIGTLTFEVIFREPDGIGVISLHNLFAACDECARDAASAPLDALPPSFALALAPVIEQIKATK